MNGIGKSSHTHTETSNAIQCQLAKIFSKSKLGFNNLKDLNNTEHFHSIALELHFPFVWLILF